MALLAPLFPRDDINNSTSPVPSNYTYREPEVVYNGPLGSSTLFGFTVRIVTIILLVLTGIACWAIAITAASRVKRRKDPARRFVPWMQAGLFMLSAAIIFQIACLACQLINRDDDSNGPPSRLSRITYTIQYQATFLLAISELIAWVAVVMLDNGIGLVKPAEVTRKRRRTTIAVYLIIGLCIIFHIILWAVYLVFEWTPTIDSLPAIEPYFLDLVARCILGIATVVTLIRAIVVRVRLRKLQHVRRLCRYYLACACLLFVATVLYRFAFTYIYNEFFWDAYWRLNKGFNGWNSVTQDSDALLLLVQCLIQVWPIFIILVVLFAEGLKSRNGLFTTSTGDGPSMQEATGLVATSPETHGSERPPSFSTPSDDVESPTYPTVAGSTQSQISPDSSRSADPTGEASSPYSTTTHPMTAISASGSIPTNATSITGDPAIQTASTATATASTPATSSAGVTGTSSHVSNSQSSVSDSAGGRYGNHHGSHDHFSWAIPDEAPPEYTAPERPLPNMPASMPAMEPAAPTVSPSAAHQASPLARPPQSETSQQPPHEATSDIADTDTETRVSAELSTSSPLPSHDEAMGLNHQADGRQPQRLHPDIPEELLHEIPRDKKS